MAKIAAKEGETRPLPGSYSEMYPNRFLKSDMLKGAKVTLTIKSIVGEGLMSEDKGANLEWIVSFVERPLQFVMNKTNAFCLYRMFGGDPHSWVGHKITLFPTTTMAFGQKQDCIRIWGSPDLAEDMPITVPQGRKKPWETVMHRVAAKNGHAPATEPRILAAFELLMWDQTTRENWLVANANLSDADKVAKLNKMLELRRARGESDERTKIC